MHYRTNIVIKDSKTINWLEVILLEKNNKIKDIHEYKKRNKNNYKNRGKKKNKVIILFLSMSVLGICIGSIYGYSIVSQLKYDINYLKKDLNTKEILLEQLKVEVDNNTSIQEIEKKAKEDLNMDYPKEGQIEYIKIED